MFRVSPGNEEPGPGRVRVISNSPSPDPGRVSKDRVPGSFRVKKDSFTLYGDGIPVSSMNGNVLVLLNFINTMN